MDLTYKCTDGVAVATMNRPAIMNALNRDVRNGLMDAVRRAEAEARKNWTAPRTPWGDPDLRGVWHLATYTPLQRPPQAMAKPRGTTCNRLTSWAWSWATG